MSQPLVMSRNFRSPDENIKDKETTEETTHASQIEIGQIKDKPTKILSKTLNLRLTDWIWLSIIIVFFVGGLLYHIFSIYNIRDKIISQSQEDYDNKQKKKLKKPKERKTNGKHKTEAKCRKVVEKLFNRHFNSVRPNFLKNPLTKRNLELDMYNHYLRFAIEYNGEQHYHFSSHFHKTKEDYEKQLERDEVKRRCCSENGVDLLCVPYYAKDNLAQYIVDNIPDRLRSKMVHGIDIKNIL
jgi:hypothetical protein